MTYAPFSLKSKRSKRFGIIICSAIQSWILPQGTTAVHCFLVLLSKIQLEFLKRRKKFTVIFMPSIFQVYFGYLLILVPWCVSPQICLLQWFCHGCLIHYLWKILFLENILGHIVSLLYMGCQSTLFNEGFITFVTFVLLLDNHLCNFYQLFSEKIYVINGRHRALHMSNDTHLLLGLIVRCEAHHLQNKKKGQ